MAEGNESPTTKLKRLLLVEDDPEVRGVYAEGLTLDGFEVVAVEDGLSPFEAYLLQGPFDALIVDCDLPRLSGRQLLQRLRAQGERAPVLLISGRAELDAAEQKALQVGPVFRKPFTLQALVHAIQDLMAAGHAGA